MVDRHNIRLERMSKIKRDTQPAAATVPSSASVARPSDVKNLTEVVHNNVSEAEPDAVAMSSKEDSRAIHEIALLLEKSAQDPRSISAPGQLPEDPASYTLPREFSFQDLDLFCAPSDGDGKILSSLGDLPGPPDGSICHRGSNPGKGEEYMASIVREAISTFGPVTQERFVEKLRARLPDCPDWAFRGAYAGVFPKRGSDRVPGVKKKKRALEGVTDFVEVD